MDGLETRLGNAARAACNVTGDGSAQAAISFVRDDKAVAQLSSSALDAKSLRAIVEDHVSPDAALITQHVDAPVKLFVSDMDSTMIEQECIDELADFAGLKDKVAGITERAMQGELDFAAALHERVGLLAGLPESAITDCLAQRISAMPGARILVQTLKSRGCRTVLVTGGFHHFADVIARQLGFDRVVGNRLAIADGRLTGALAGPVADSATKLAVLEDERAQLPGGIVLASGDGANDVPMLEAAELGFAYFAKPKARHAANGWIDSGDLTSILDLLGIPENEWVKDNGPDPAIAQHVV